MSKNITMLSILFVSLFLSSSLIVGVGMMSVPQSVLSLDNQDVTPAGYPATDLDNRNTPVSILVYNEFADTTTAAPNNEFRNTMDSIKATYGEQFRYDNLTDYTTLASELSKYDILLIPEQEKLTTADITTIAAAWTGILADFVSNGGNLIALDCYSPLGPNAAPTLQLLNATGIVSITSPISGDGWTNTRVNDTDVLVRGVEGSWPAPDGSVYFDTTDCVSVVENTGHSVVARKILGAGHVVLLGFDLYDREANSDALLANAIRLHRHVVFDDSHAGAFEIDAELFELANYFATNGFAVSQMNDFSEEYLAACDILVLTLSYAPYVAAEIDIIEDFVENGGGLFVCSDFGTYGSETDELIQRFGFWRYDTTNAIEDTDDLLNGNPANIPFEGENIHNHSITLTVDRIEVYSCAVFTTVPEGATVLAKTDGDGTATLNNTAVAASVTYGNGRIVVFGDSNALTNSDSDADAVQNWQDSYNEVFLLNTLRWLSAAGIEEKKVLFDASHAYNLYVTASYKGFANFLTENGYTVFWMSTFYEALVEECDVFVIEDGSIEYTTAEVNFIVTYVSNGGKLLLLGGRDTYGNETDPIGQRFGMDLNNTGYLIDSDDSAGVDYYISYNTSNFGNHPIMQGLTQIDLHYGTAFETIGSGTALIITDNDDTCQWAAGGLANALPTMAAKEHNKGRVVYSADYYIPRDNQDGDIDGTSNLYDADNPLLLLNIFHWLIEDRAPTVEVIFPNGGEVLNGTETVTWEGLDFDNDPMVYDLYMSDNNGSSWWLVEQDLTAMEYDLNTTLYSDTNSNMIRVVVTANGVTAEDQSDNPFEIDNEPDPIIPLPTDLTLLVLIAAGGVIVVIVIVIIMKKKK